MPEKPNSYEFQNDGREELIRKTRNRLFELAVCVDASKLDRETKQALISINSERDYIINALEKGKWDIKKEIKKLAKDINNLQDLYPDDLEVKDIVALFQDLQLSFKKDAGPIDTWPSVLEINKELAKQISPFEEKRIPSSEAFEKIDPESNLGQQLAKLQKAGVPVAYLIEVSKDAPTVVIFPQIHMPVNIDLYRELKKVYTKLGIKNDLIEFISETHDLIARGVKTIDSQTFLEGVGQEKNIAMSEDFYSDMSGSWSDVEKRFSGIETPLIYNYAINQSPELDFRITTENLFFADYIADYLSAEKIKTASFVIGSGHEKGSLVKPMPISSVLASLGINTIIVDFNYQLEKFSAEADLMTFLDVIRNNADTGLVSIFSVDYELIDTELPNYTDDELKEIEENIENINLKDPEIRLKVAASAKKSVMEMLKETGLSFNDFVRIIKEIKKDLDPEKVINQKSGNN